MIDFPPNPTVGQTIQVGNTIYKCVLASPAVWSATVATSGIPDAPADGSIYGRKNAGWSIITKAEVGLGNVDNTSDANKPVSTAQAAALVAKAGDTMTGALNLVTPVFNDWSKKAINSEWYFEQAATATPAMDAPTGAVGTGTRWARSDHIHPSDSSKVNKSGDTMTGGLAAINGIDLGPNANGDSYIDFRKNTTEDYTARLVVLAGADANMLRLQAFGSQYNYAALHIEGSQGGLANGANINASNAGVNRIAFGWRSDASLGLRVDASQFNNSWPINITGTAGYLNGYQASAFPLQDNCNNMGFVSGDWNKPYMRFQGGGTIRQLIWQTTQSNEPWAIRDASDGGGRYLETSGTAGAFGIRYNVSDERVKNNIVTSTVDATSVVKGMRFISFDWGAFGVGTGHVPLGFSGQNLQGLVPNMVTVVEQPVDTPLHQFGNILQVNEGTVMAYLAKALQEALARLDALEAA